MRKLCFPPCRNSVSARTEEGNSVPHGGSVGGQDAPAPARRTPRPRETEFRPPVRSETEFRNETEPFGVRWQSESASGDTAFGSSAGGRGDVPTRGQSESGVAAKARRKTARFRSAPALQGAASPRRISSCADMQNGPRLATRPVCKSSCHAAQAPMPSSKLPAAGVMSRWSRT